MSAYPYPYNTYFPNDIDISVLELQIRDSEITSFLLSTLVDEINNTITFYFLTELDSNEIEILENILIDYTKSSLGSILYQRYNNALITSQPDVYVLPDANITLSEDQLFSKILHGTPTANRTITLPLISNIITSIPNLINNDSYDFTIINESSTFIYTLLPTTIGNNIIEPGTSALFRIKFNGSEVIADSYVIYRIS